MTVEVVGGTKGPVKLDEDLNIVLLIKNNQTQKVRVVVSKDDESYTRTYGLTNLVLTPAE